LGYKADFYAALLWRSINRNSCREKHKDFRDLSFAPNGVFACEQYAVSPHACPHLWKRFAVNDNHALIYGRDLALMKAGQLTDGLERTRFQAGINTGMHCRCLARVLVLLKV